MIWGCSYGEILFDALNFHDIKHKGGGIVVCGENRVHFESTETPLTNQEITVAEVCPKQFFFRSKESNNKLTLLIFSYDANTFH